MVFSKTFTFKLPPCLGYLVQSTSHFSHQPLLSFPSFNQHVESMTFLCVVLTLDDEPEEEEELDIVKFQVFYARAHLNCFIMWPPLCLSLL